MVIARVDMAVRSITGSSGKGPNNIAQNCHRTHFTRNTEDTPLRLFSTWLDLYINQNVIDETHDIDNSEDGNFPATKLNNDRRAHAHDNCQAFSVGNLLLCFRAFQLVNSSIIT